MFQNPPSRSDELSSFFFSSIVQNLTVFSIIYMIRIRIFGRGELIQRTFLGARYLVNQDWIIGRTSTCGLKCSCRNPTMLHGGNMGGMLRLVSKLVLVTQPDNMSGRLMIVQTSKLLKAPHKHRTCCTRYPGPRRGDMMHYSSETWRVLTSKKSIITYSHRCVHASMPAKAGTRLLSSRPSSDSRA